MISSSACHESLGNRCAPGISPAPNRLWELFTTSRIISLGSMMPRPCRLVHRLRTTTAAGLVPLLLAASVSACATRSSRPAVPADTQPASLNLWSSAPVGEWSRVEAVPVGTQIMVQLYDDVGPPDLRRRVTGRLQEVTADTLTVVLDERQRIVRPLARSDVHIVRIRRPIMERWAGWLTLGVVASTIAAFLGRDSDVTVEAQLGLLFGAPASLPGFLLHRWKRIYEVPPAAARLITHVDVPVTNGDMVLRSREVSVTVFHIIQAGRPRNETIGLTVCLSSHPARCTGQFSTVEGPVRRLSSPLTATLQFGDETVPGDTPVSIYVHVVLVTGSPWRPAPDEAVPQLGDPEVLDVETVTRRITVVDR